MTRTFGPFPQAFFAHAIDPRSSIAASNTMIMRLLRSLIKFIWL